MYKKHMLGLLISVATLIFGGCQNTTTESAKTVGELEEVMAGRVIRTTYYDSSIFEYLEIDDLLALGFDSETIEVAKTTFEHEAVVEDDEMSEENEQIETALVDATSNNSSTSNSGSSSNNSSTSNSGSSSNNSSTSNSSSSSNNSSTSNSGSSSNNNSTSNSSSSSNNNSTSNSSSSSNNNSTSNSSSSSNNNSTSNSSSSSNNNSTSNSSSSSNNNSTSNSGSSQPSTPPVVEETKKPVDILDWNYIKSTLIEKGQSLGMTYDTALTRDNQGYESPYQSSYMTVSNDTVIGYIGTQMERCVNQGWEDFNLEMVVQSDGNVLIYLIR